MLAEGGLSRLNQFIIAVILASVLVVVIESEHAIAVGHATLFRALELVFGVFFLVGYGDAYSVTTAGRVPAGLTAITGILAAAFSDALHAKRVSANRDDAEGRGKE